MRIGRRTTVKCGFSPDGTWISVQRSASSPQAAEASGSASPGVGMGRRRQGVEAMCRPYPITAWKP